MSMNCWMSDAVARLRNAYMDSSVSVRMPYSKKVYSALKVLEREELLGSVQISREEGDKQFIDVKLSEDGFTEISPISTPSKRVHCKKNEIPFYKRGFGTIVISTSHGMMTSKEARDKGVGGKLILKAF